MKRGLEVVHGAIDLIQPQPQLHDHCDYTTLIGYPPLASNAYSNIKPIIESRCVNSERNELSEWVENVTKQLIDHNDLPEINPHQQEVHNQRAIMVCEENCVPSMLGEFRPNKYVRRSYGGDESATDHFENEGLRLITVLLECAVAISVDNLGEAHKMLLELTQMASPYGTSCGERVVAYFAKAMSSRVINSWLGICSPLLISNHKSHAHYSAFQVFNNVSPFIKFAHFTSNQAIFETFHHQNRVHIIDLDIMQGLQWPALFHILATRIDGPPHVRMTGLGTSMDLLLETGKQLSIFAKRIGMSFEFHPLACKFGELDSSMIQLRHGETLAVHWLKHSLYDQVGPDWKSIRLLRELSPKVITLVEQDISHGGSFLDRFVGSLHYYSTIFDSLGSTLACDDQNRHRIEHDLLYKEINNILAIGGPARSGEDKFRHWRRELEKSNSFMQVGMSANSMAQAQLILNMFQPSHGYSLVQGDGTLRLGWKETSLYTASAWTSTISHVYG